MNNILPLFHLFLKRLFFICCTLAVIPAAYASAADELPIYGQIGQVEFQLLSTLNSEAHGLEVFQGTPILLMFGFTHCPQVCPVSLQKMAGVRARLPKPEALQLVFVSVDAERDTVSRMRTYLEGFRANIVGFTGSEAELRQVAKGFAATFFKPTEEKDAEIQHTDRLYLIDQKGQVRQLFDQSASLDTILKPIESLLRVEAFSVEKQDESWPASLLERMKEWMK